VDVEPVKGDDYQALLPLVPGVVRGPDGRININGSAAIQSGLTVSSSNVADPSTGNRGFELPMDAVESVSVLPNPYSAEYGRFSSGITQIQTRKGESRWGFLVNPTFLTSLMPI
jgi:outer membrane receptor protein involved in Fe transport